MEVLDMSVSLEHFNLKIKELENLVLDLTRVSNDKIELLFIDVNELKEVYDTLSDTNKLSIKRIEELEKSFEKILNKLEFLSDQLGLQKENNKDFKSYVTRMEKTVDDIKVVLNNLIRTFGEQSAKQDKSSKEQSKIYLLLVIITISVMQITDSNAFDTLLKFIIGY
jgi:uncharacterized ubiquitin-like protein YukD